jgi:hypothetical protein
MGENAQMVVKAPLSATINIAMTWAALRESLL